MIKLQQALYFTEIGLKDNQEDFVYPPVPDTSTRVFILCDGVGGQDKGEVASATAATTLGDCLRSYTYIDASVFNAALSKAYGALDALDVDSATKPATTMTCLCFNDDSCLAAHMGDSRIYHIRPSLFDQQTRKGGILYQSSDHSLVNDLLKAGELTEDKARDFPRKNVITRAMQPGVDRRCKADVFMFDNICSGDYFFLCSDGILEQLSNDMLCGILADSTLDDNTKLERIKSICDGQTRDNYSCWLIPVDKASIKPTSDISQVIKAEIDEKAASDTVVIPRKKRRIGSRSPKTLIKTILNAYLHIIVFAVLSITLIFIAMTIYKFFKNW